METFIISLEPIFTFLISLLGAALLAFGGYALKRIGDRFGLDAESAISQKLQEGLHWAIEFAEQRLHEQGKKYTIETERELVATAANYVIERFPDALAFFSITEERLIEMLEARLNQKEYDGA